MGIGRKDQGKSNTGEAGFTNLGSVMTGRSMSMAVKGELTAKINSLRSACGIAW